MKESVPLANRNDSGDAYIIYQQTLTETKQKCTHTAFCRELIQSLVQTLLTAKCHTTESSPNLISTRQNQKTVHYLEKRKKQRDCAVCSERKENGKRCLTLSALLGLLEFS